MADGGFYERFAATGLSEALEDSPVVLVHGPRQCGKTTLAKLVGDGRGHVYVTFDDNVAREAAESDPAGFVDGLPSRVILDEVQRVPGIFTALKAAVDRRASRVVSS
jgi:predicted AAA+ superfamily ATPase